MTRKRYIKLLMALGIPRNVANEDAKGCQELQRPYSREFDRLREYAFYHIAIGYQLPPKMLEVLAGE